MSNKVKYPSRTLEDGPPSMAESVRGIESPYEAYRRDMDNMDMKTKEQLMNKEKALKHKLSVALADNPPIDTTKEEEAILHWEREKSLSLYTIQQSIEYQQNQIEQMREAFERKVKTIQDRMEMTKRTLADKEAYFIKMLFQARQRLDLATNPPESNRVRKLRVELKIIQDGINSLENRKRKRMGLTPIQRKTEEKEEEEDDYDSDDTDVYNEERDGGIEYPVNSGQTGRKAWKQFRTERDMSIREK